MYLVCKVGKRDEKKNSIFRYTMPNSWATGVWVICLKVTTAFVGADELLVSDGTNSLVGVNDVDLSEGGIYVVDLGYENATTGGATISASIQNGGSSASPTVGACIVTAEYKQV